MCVVCVQASHLDAKPNGVAAAHPALTPAAEGGAQNDSVNGGFVDTG